MRHWFGLWLAILAFASLPVAAEGPSGVCAPADRPIDECLLHQPGRLPLVSAHRGGDMPGYPENAIETMAHALTFGPALLEVDVRRLKDGTLILMHDESFDRTTTGTGPVAMADWAYAASLALEDEKGTQTAFRIPALPTALHWAKEAGAVLTLDIKPGAGIGDVMAAVRAAGMEHRIVLITYSLDQAKLFHAAAPNSMLSVSVADAAAIRAVKASGIDKRRILAWTGLEVRDRAFYAALHKEGWLVMLGTLGRPDRSIDARIAASGDDRRYLDLVALGIDVIATDRHAAVQAVLPH